MDNILIGNIDIPNDYFDLSEIDKKELCIQIMDTMLLILDKKLKPEVNRIDVLEEVLNSSIQANIDLEQYEVAAVMRDIRNLINE
jgi:hypothetical protein